MLVPRGTTGTFPC